MIESYIIASADHQDALFRLLQYAAKLIAGAYHGRRRKALLSLSNAIDSSRIMNRTFGIVYALRAVVSGGSATFVDRLADLSLLCYHPYETGYWVLSSTNSPDAARRRMCSRVCSFFGMLWSVFASISVARRLRLLQMELLTVQERRAEDEALFAAAGGSSAICSTGGGNGTAAIGDGTTGSVSGASSPASGCVTNADEILQQLLEDEADESELTAQIVEARRRLCKLLLDAVMNLNWAIDHPTHSLASWKVGLLGTCSAYFGLRLSYDAHVLAAERASAVAAAADEEEEEVTRAAMRIASGNE